MTAADRIGRRVNRLAHGLHSLGVDSTATVVVACCDRHREDRGVAVAAAAEVGAAVIVLGGRPLLGTRRPDLVLACEEGLARWRELAIPARVVSDAPGTLWWRLLESRQPDRRLRPGRPRTTSEPAATARAAS